jgi:hypothetical protein
MGGSIKPTKGAKRGSDGTAYSEPQRLHTLSGNAHEMADPIVPSLLHP